MASKLFLMGSAKGLVEEWQWSGKMGKTRHTLGIGKPMNIIMVAEESKNNGNFKLS